MKVIAGVLAALAAAVVAVPASAAISIVSDAKCVSVSNSAGCLFNGNLANQSHADETMLAYNPVRDPDILLKVLHETGGPANVNFTFNVLTSDGPDALSGTWSVTGYLIDFLAVKAGTQFVLYKLDTPAWGGTWSTAGLVNDKGKQKGLSHLTFMGREGGPPPIPEPGTWALMIGGFGLVGGALRRRPALAAA